jgi:hypothetical protein
MFTALRRVCHMNVGTAPLLLLGFISATICIVEFHNFTVEPPFSYLLGVMFILSVISLTFIGSVIDRSRTKLTCYGDKL